MALRGKQLGQLRPADTTAASLFSPDTNQQAEIVWLVVCNTTGTAADYSVFLDNNGTTYDETTAHYFAKSLAANDTLNIEVHWLMDDPTGNLGVKTGTNNALTFTAYGELRDTN